MQLRIKLTTIMHNYYDRKTDRFLGHDYPGVRGAGFVQFEMDELELGARAALAIGDPEQYWWEIHYKDLTELAGGHT